MLRKEFLESADYFGADGGFGPGGVLVGGAEDAEEGFDWDVPVLPKAEHGQEKPGDVMQVLYVRWVEEGQPKKLADEIYAKLLPFALRIAVPYAKKDAHLKKMPFLWEEMAQNAMEVIVKNKVLEKYDPHKECGAQFQTYAIKSIHNNMCAQLEEMIKGKFREFKAVRNYKVKGFVNDTDGYVSGLLTQDSSRRRPEDILAHAEGYEAELVRAIRDLPEDQYKLVKAFYRENNPSLRSIGRDMGTQQNAPCLLHSKAMAFLKRRMTWDIDATYYDIDSGLIDLDRV
ncbi:MAG: hypothetical protein WBK77_03155 [Alphaproteobacteria bacterium]